MKGYAFVAAVALGTTFLLTPVVRWLAIRFGAVVAPSSDARHVHTKPTPTLGGAAMFVCFLAAMAALGGAFAQRRDPEGFPRGNRKSPDDIRRQENALARDDFRRNREDVAEILMLAESLMADLSRDGVFVVDVNNIKAAGRIEKLARDVKGRLKRF